MRIEPTWRLADAEGALTPPLLPVPTSLVRTGERVVRAFFRAASAPVPTRPTTS
jgi:hypothetical protein